MTSKHAAHVEAGQADIAPLDIQASSLLLLLGQGYFHLVQLNDPALQLAEFLTALRQTRIMLSNVYVVYGCAMPRVGGDAEGAAGGCRIER